MDPNGSYWISSGSSKFLAAFRLKNFQSCLFLEIVNKQLKGVDGDGTGKDQVLVNASFHKPLHLINL